jgi:hypothetical protein
VSAVALVIGAVNVILKHLAELPDGSEARALREQALGHIEEVARWNTSRPPVERRDATMKSVLALHVAVKKLAVRVQLRVARGSGSYGPTALGQRPPLASCSVFAPEAPGVANAK